jgi:HEAT repeat protein
VVDPLDHARRHAEFERIRVALAAAGLPSADFGRFTNNPYPDVILPSVFDVRGAVPVLLSLLPTVSHPDALAAVVAHLETPYARPAAAGPLLALFRRTQEGDSDLKWAIGNALSVVTTPAYREELLELALDKRHGHGRQMIVERLARISGDPRIVEALRTLATDPDVALHALAGLRRRLGAAAAADIIRPLLTHPAEGVRRGAQYNIRKIAKASRSPTG